MHLDLSLPRHDQSWNARHPGQIQDIASRTWVTQCNFHYVWLPVGESELKSGTLAMTRKIKPYFCHLLSAWLEDYVKAYKLGFLLFYFSYIVYVKKYVKFLLDQNCHVVLVFDGRPLPAKIVRTDLLSCCLSCWCRLIV